MLQVRFMKLVYNVVPTSELPLQEGIAVYVLFVPKEDNFSFYPPCFSFQVLSIHGRIISHLLFCHFQLVITMPYWSHVTGIAVH